jgi:flagellin
MGISINTNVGALSASAATAAINKSMETSMERLSTGKRINTAADDAAGVAIASRLTAEIRGTNQAIRNAMDGQALIDSAEGAHQEVEFILQRMRELSVQAVNDTNSAIDRNYLSQEMKQLTAEIDRIAATTTWAGQKLLDGSFLAKTFQIGARSGEVLNASVTSTASGNLGINKIDSVAVANAEDATATATHDAEAFDVLGPTGSATVEFAAESSAKTVATAVNAATSTTGVTATAVTNAKLSAVATGAISFSLQGGGSAVTISATVQSASDLTNLLTAINSASGTTGVTATFDGSSKAALILTEADGDNITIEDFDDGGTGTATLQAMNFDASALSSAAAVTLTAGGDDSSIVTGTFRMSANGAFTVSNQVDGSAGAVNTAVTGYFGASDTDASDLTSVSSIDIGTRAGASAAIDVIDGALRQIANQRANLGAISNRLDSTVKNLTNISTNLEAGRGRIEDADFAAETTNLAKSQILQQASMAMLAQANASKQGVLSLLQR